MASVEKRKDGRDGYVVRWRDEAGKQRKKSFPKKALADRYRAEVEHSLNVGAYVDPVAGKTTFRAYAEQWSQAQPHRANTAANTKSRLEVHAYPVLGDRPSGRYGRASCKPGCPVCRSRRAAYGRSGAPCARCSTPRCATGSSAPTRASA